MTVFQILLNSMMIFCVLGTILFLIYYSPRLKGWFHALDKQKKLVNPKKNKIAVLVPARNESEVVGALLTSLNNQTYDKENFDVVVITKDEKDETNEIAKNFGAEVFVVPEKVNKSYDVDKFLKKVLSESPNKYDAYLIMDADCIMDKCCLEEFNNALSTGAQVVQAKKLIKNYLVGGKKSSSIWSKCNGLIWTMIDELGNKHKTAEKATNMTIGTGVMIRADVVKEIGGFPYKQTLTEDIEFMFDCALHNYKTFYYSHAKIYMEEATSHDMTNKRRSRWMTGVVDSTRIYKNKLKTLPKTKQNKRNYYYTTCIEKVYAYIGMWSMFSAAFGIMSFVLGVVGNADWVLALIYCGVSVLAIYLSFFALTLACFVADYENLKLSFWGKLAVLFFHPIFYMEYIPIVAKAILGKQTKVWEVIERVKAINNTQIGFEPIENVKLNQINGEI